MTIIFLESPEPDTQGFWRKQNNMTRGSVNLWEIGNLRGVYHVDMFCAGVSFICIYVRGLAKMFWSYKNGYIVGTYIISD